MEYEILSSVYVLTKNYTLELSSSFPVRCGTYGNVWNVDDKTFLTLFKGVAWDGSTCAIDTEMCMEASLVHDWLCHTNDTVWGLNKSDWKKYRKLADKEYYRLLRKNGMSWIRAKSRYIAIRSFATFKGVTI